MNSFNIHSFNIHSFIHSCIHSFIHAFTHPFNALIHSFIRSFVHTIPFPAGAVCGVLDSSSPFHSLALCCHICLCCVQPALLLPLVRGHVEHPPVQNTVRGGGAGVLPQGPAGERQVRVWIRVVL